MKVTIVDNSDRAHCDDCSNSPIKMVVVDTSTSIDKADVMDMYGSLFLCKICFAKLKRLELPK